MYGMMPSAKTVSFVIPLPLKRFSSWNRLLDFVMARQVETAFSETPGVGSCWRAGTRR
jgi:hypothetical protein